MQLIKPCHLDHQILFLVIHVFIVIENIILNHGTVENCSTGLNYYNRYLSHDVAFKNEFKDPFTDGHLYLLAHFVFSNSILKRSEATKLVLLKSN